MTVGLKVITVHTVGAPHEVMTKHNKLRLRELAVFIQYMNHIYALYGQKLVDSHVRRKHPSSLRA